MKALTIRQPWAWLIAQGIKTVEYRSWRPSPGKLPPGSALAIHAAQEWYEEDRAAAMIRYQTLIPEELETGAVVAVVRIEEIVRIDSRQYEWRLGCGISLPYPVTISGKRGLWEVDLTP